MNYSLWNIFNNKYLHILGAAYIWFIHPQLYSKFMHDSLLPYTGLLLLFIHVHGTYIKMYVYNVKLKSTPLGRYCKQSTNYRHRTTTSYQQKFPHENTHSPTQLSSSTVASGLYTLVPKMCCYQKGNMLCIQNISSLLWINCRSITMYYETKLKVNQS